MKNLIIDIRKPIRLENTYDKLSTYIRYGQELLHAGDKEEIVDLLKESKTWEYVDKAAFKKIADLDFIKERLLFYWIAENIQDLYQKEQGLPGRKSDRIRRMFESLYNDEVNAQELVNKFDLSYHIISQHRRFDTCPERGKTYVKKGMIGRHKKER